MQTAVQIFTNIKSFADAIIRNVIRFVLVLQEEIDEIHENKQKRLYCLLPKSTSAYEQQVCVISQVQMWLRNELNP